MTKRWRHGAWWAGGTLVVLFGMSTFTPWLRDALSMPLIDHWDPIKADVIIVLGAGTRKHGDPLPPQAKQRVLEGVALYTQGYATHMIISGGLDKNTGYVEADEMKAYAVTQGVPADAIIAERQSTSTWENTTYSLAIMREHQWSVPLVVTSPYHTWRACRMFEKQSQNITSCVPAPFGLLPATSIYERLTDTRSVIREYGAIVLARLQGRL